MQRTTLDKNSGNRAAAAIELGFDDGAFGRTVRIRLEFENFGLQPDHFEQLVEIHLLGRRHLDVDDVAAERLEGRISGLVANGVDEDSLREIVREAVELGRRTA